MNYFFVNRNAGPNNNQLIIYYICHQFLQYFILFKPKFTLLWNFKFTKYSAHILNRTDMCPECSTWIATHTEGPAWFVMCNMCVMMTEIKTKEGVQKRSLLTRGDQIYEKKKLPSKLVFTKKSFRGGVG